MDRKRRRQLSSSQTKNADPRDRRPAQDSEIAVHSAGGVVCLDQRVVLISTRRGSRWQLPKGRLHEGESPDRAALREVREETGLEAEILGRLPTIEFVYQRPRGERVTKRVDFFLMRPIGGSLDDYSRLEVTSAEWVPWPEADRRLTYDNERRVLGAARESQE